MSRDIFNIKYGCGLWSHLGSLMFSYWLHKIFFSINTQKLSPVWALLYSLPFEKTGLLEKSTFHPLANVLEFGLRKRFFDVLLYRRHVVLWSFTRSVLVNWTTHYVREQCSCDTKKKILKNFLHAWPFLRIRIRNSLLRVKLFSTRNRSIGGTKQIQNFMPFSHSKKCF